jgi:hypothetical protein
MSENYFNHLKEYHSQALNGGYSGYDNVHAMWTKPREQTRMFTPAGESTI